MKKLLILAVILLIPSALNAAAVDSKNIPCPNPTETRDSTGQCVKMIFEPSQDSDISTTKVRERSGALQNPLEAGSIQELLAALIKGIVRLGLIALVLAFVWTGFLFAAAQGNEEKIRSARQTLLWTVIGGAVLLGAELIANVIAATVQSLQ